MSLVHMQQNRIERRIDDILGGACFGTPVTNQNFCVVSLWKRPGATNLDLHEKRSVARACLQLFNNPATPASRVRPSVNFLRCRSRYFVTLATHQQVQRRGTATLATGSAQLVRAISLRFQRSLQYSRNLRYRTDCAV